MSFTAGKFGEQQVMNLLQEINIDPTFNTGDSRKELAKWDLKFSFQDKEYTAEVKYDRMSSITGNIAIEVYNHKSDYFSGVLSSEADLWFVYVNQKLYVTTKLNLLKYIHKTVPFKIVEGGDDNSTMLIYKNYDILKIFKELKNGPIFQKWLAAISR